MKARDMAYQMESEGYEPGPPSWESEQIDREVCNLAGCACGHQGLLYHPYIKQLTTRRSYRAFGVCPACSEAQEF